MSEKELWYIMCNCDDIIKAEDKDEAYKIFCERHHFREEDAEFVSYGRIENEEDIY